MKIPGCLNFSLTPRRVLVMQILFSACRWPMGIIGSVLFLAGTVLSLPGRGLAWAGENWFGEAESWFIDLAQMSRAWRKKNRT